MEKMTSANPSSGVIILQGTQNYLEWLYTIEMTARSNIQDVWDFINPAKPSSELSPIPVLPNRPSPKDIIQTANSISDLSGAQVEDYKIRLSEWKETRAEIEDIRRITGSVQNKVLGSISERLLPQLRGKSNVADILSYLNKRYRPTDQARKQEVISRWNKVKKFPNNITVMSWLDEWELVYADAKELNLPHVMDPQAQYDFLYSIESIAGAWTELKLAMIDDQASSGEKFMDFYDLLEAFRHKQRLNAAFNKNLSKSIGGSNSSGVFTISGTEQDTIHKDRDQKGAKNCLCGMKHKFDDCFYLNFNNTTRPQTFKYRKEIFDKINGKLKAAYMGKVRAYITNKLNYDPKTTPSAALKCNEEGDIDSENKNSDISSMQMGSFINNHIHDQSSSFSVNDLKSYHLYEHWVLDGGSDIHICNKSMLKNFSISSDSTLNHKIIAGSTEYEVEAWGSCTVEVQTPNGKSHILLNRTAYIPDFMTSLVSLPKLVNKGVHWSSRFPDRLEKSDGSLFCHLFKSGDHIVFEPQENKANFKKDKNCFKNWAVNLNVKENKQKPSYHRHKTFSKDQLHRILGHPSPEVIDHVENSVRDGNITIIGGKSPSTVHCQTCALSKSHQIISRSSEKEHPESRPFERVTIDLIPMKEGYNSNTQIIHFQCSKTLFNMIFTMFTKNESLKIVEKVLNLVLSMKYQVKYLHLDGESSLQLSLDNIAVIYGLKIERSAPYSSSQNGQSEVNGRWIILKARAFSIEANLPSNLWPNLVVTVGYLMNRTPSKKLGWKTPFECVYNYKPFYSHLDIIGSKVYSHKKNIPKLDRLLSRAHIGYLIGWESTNIYKVWVPSLKRVINTRDVLIDSGNVYDPHEIDIFALRETPEVEILKALEWESVDQSMSVKNSVFIDEDIIEDTIPVPIGYRENIENKDNKINKVSDKEEIRGNEINDHHNKKEKLYTKDGNRDLPKAKGNSAKRAALINPDLDEGNIISSGRTRNQAKKGAMANQYHIAFSTALSKMKRNIKWTRETLPPPPKGWNQMIRHQFASEFKRAAEKEYYTLEDKDTWSHVEENEIPHDAEIIPVLWIFTYKFDAEGILIKFKARLCARGDLQISEEETYAATLASQSFRAMMAITAAHDLEIRQYDVINAFVNAPIRGEVYCSTPKGFEKTLKGKKAVLRLNKALYGLKFSPLYWYEELVSFLLNNDLYQVPGVNCMFTNHLMNVIFYVDDIIITYHHRDIQNADQFEESLSRRFEIRRISDDSLFLGIQIIRDRPVRKLWLSQANYIESLKSTFHIEVGKPPKTPLPQLPLMKYEGIATLAQIKGYQQKVGKVNFAAVSTRADIARSVSILSRFLQNPGPQHLDAIDHLLKYLVSTSNFAICYDGQYYLRNSASTKKALMTFSDASYGDDQETRHSSCGFALLLYGGIVHYKATKQKTVTTSSTEAELLAVSMLAKEYIWWTRLFEHVGLQFNDDPVIYLDNQQTIRLIKSEVTKLVTKLKHIDIHQLWIRQEFQAGNIKVEWVPTTEMVADGFTKELSPQKHATFLRQLGMENISDRIQNNH